MKNDANRRLATALGWTNIVEVAGALLGTPPKGEPECRNQAKVPDWTGDWRDCGPLMVKYLMAMDFARSFIMAQCPFNMAAATPDECGGDRNAMARLAAVRAVCAKLEEGQ